MKKLPLLAAAAVGYVLGSRAGREHYEQIASGARKVAKNPRVQAASSQVQDAVAQQASAAADVAKDKVTSVASAAADKARREASINPAP